MAGFSQVDVFSTEPLLGNPVAVLHDADDLTDADLAAMARWTNLSETTFLLAPTDPNADYRVRIWTPGGELPFAGHPTLGSAHAWLSAGGVPHADGVVVQECGAGLVSVRRGEVLSFAAPPLVRSGPVEVELLPVIARALRIDEGDIIDAAWIDNGPGWIGVLLADAGAVLALQPDYTAFEGLEIGVLGRYADGEVDVEVRAFVPTMGIPEDPVTGSLNAGFGQWLMGDRLPTAYVASQGTAIGRRGRVHLSRADDGQVWVGGATRTIFSGEWHL